MTTTVAAAAFSALVDQALNAKNLLRSKSQRDAATIAMKGKATERVIAMEFGVSRSLVSKIHTNAAQGKS